jgi:hypothetical protein
MNAPLFPHADAAHPNQVDLKRIERLLKHRKRYRYVKPVVFPYPKGYQIVSPCCSRTIDPEGGPIDIARIEFLEESGDWRLWAKDHRGGSWIEYGRYPKLEAALVLLNEDPERAFWQ